MLWLIGNKGMLGSQLEARFLKKGVAFTGSDREVDITDLSAMQAFVKGKDIRWIVNCSAYTAVDKAESEEELARKINAQGVENIATVAHQLGAKVVHFSTDYVFDGSGDRPWKETDEPKPLSAYGRTKREGEVLLMKKTSRYFIFRISWLYGVFGPNFVKTMLRLMNEKEELNVVSDQVGSPTYCARLAKNIVKLVSSDSSKYGVYHYSDKGVISWHDFACYIQKLALKAGLLQKKIPVHAIPTEKYPTPAKRPANSALDKYKVKKELGFRVKGWKSNLRRYFDEMKATEKK